MSGQKVPLQESEVQTEHRRVDEKTVGSGRKTLYAGLRRCCGGRSPHVYRLSPEVIHYIN